MRLPGFGPPSGSQIAQADFELKDKYRRILYWLAEGGQPRNADERRVAKYFPHASRETFLKAASNLRVQEGVRERFMKGMVRSARYRPMMRRIFAREGLPPDLVALAAVESGFDPRARSSAGAAGIWQFMRGTARKYLHISRYRDDRMNPYRATVAAARLLRENYLMLGNWPLAITAYDYGPGGIARAAAQYNGDYVQIVKHYNGPHFGFAARNYYPEFLAAVEVYRHSNRYFPGLNEISTPLLLADEHSTPAPVRHAERVTHYRIRRGDTLSRIAHVYGVSVESLLSENDLSNPRRLRAGDVLAIPAAAPAARHAAPVTHRYRVERGDTLYGIARRAGVSLRRLMAVNRIYRPRALSIGMILHIPGV
jgi:membrane-bound lytic murein transglycosylase D